MGKQINVHLLELDTGKVNTVQKDSFEKLQEQFGFDKSKEAFGEDLRGFLGFCEKEGWQLTDDMYFSMKIFETGAIFTFYKEKDGVKIPVLTGGCSNKAGHEKQVWPVLVSSFSDIQIPVPPIPFIAWYKEPSDKLTAQDYQTACTFNYLFASLYFYL